MTIDPDNPTGLSASILEKVDRICLAFEEAWRQQLRPSIQQYLGRGNGETRSALLHELLLLDIDYRIRGGEHPTLADYVSDFPQEVETIRSALNSVRPDTVDGRDEQAVVSTNSAPPRDPSMPRLDRYQILERVGIGGCGAVYKAYDEELQRYVAVKIPHQDRFASAAAKEMFLREARSLATLRNPGIVPVHDVGFYQGGEGDTTCFIVSEYMDGGNLADHVAEHRLSPDEAARIAIALAEALHYAHGKGLVHRDVKLSNILRDADGNVYIADFGLALRDEDIGKGFGFAGTPTNMSPEQARGEANLVDGRTDVYGLGVVLYELLTGQRPFESDDVNNLLDQIERQEPKPLRQINDQVPKELERTCLKSLSKRPSDRHSTAMDMADDLRRFTRRHTESVRTMTPAMWTMAAIFVAVVTLVLTVGRGWVSPSDVPDASGSATAIRSLAVLPFRQIGEGQAADHVALGTADSLITKLSNLRQVVVRPTESVQDFPRHGADALSAGRELQVDAVLEGSLQQSADKTRTRVRLLRVSDGQSLWAATFDEDAVDLFSVQDVISAQVARALAAQLTAEETKRIEHRFTENRKAYEAYIKGRYHWNQRAIIGPRAIRKGIEYFLEAIDNDPLYALAYAGLAESYALTNIYGESLDEEAFPRARAAAQKALELDSGLTEAQATLAFVSFYHDWDWDRAEQEFQRAIELNPNYATAHQWYGELLYFSQRFDESIVQLKRAAELDPLSPVIKGLQGAPFMWRRDYKRARQEYAKAIELHPHLVVTLYGLAVCYEQESRFDKALEVYQAEGYAPGQAYVLARMGQETKAREILDKTMRSSPHKAFPYHVAIIHIGLGEFDQAFKWLRKAYESRDEHMTWLKVDSKLDPIRDDPRFLKLLKDVGWTK